MSKTLVTVFVIDCFLLFLSVQSFGDEIRIPSRSAYSGQMISIPIEVDQVENLAGIKLVLVYDPDVLEFKTIEKTASTSSLMHVVNDKKPGRLVIVMAGAKGIMGKNIDLVRMQFKINSKLKLSKEIESEIDIIELEMMSDQLKQLKYRARTESIRINP